MELDHCVLRPRPSSGAGGMLNEFDYFCNAPLYFQAFQLWATYWNRTL